jgi:hypothetical protein
LEQALSKESAAGLVIIPPEPWYGAGEHHGLRIVTDGNKATVQLGSVFVGYKCLFKKNSLVFLGIGTEAALVVDADD